MSGVPKIEVIESIEELKLFWNLKFKPLPTIFPESFVSQSAIATLPTLPLFCN